MIFSLAVHYTCTWIMELSLGYYSKLFINAGISLKDKIFYLIQAFFAHEDFLRKKYLLVTKRTIFPCLAKAENTSSTFLLRH